MMFWRKKPRPPTVGLFDLGRDGAAFSWTGDESRAVALEMFVELARRLEGEARAERLRLSGLVGMPIDVADTASFVRAAPQLLQKQYRAFEFEFRLNDGKRSYRIRHLDQGVPAIGFETPVEGEPFWSTLGSVLADYAAKNTGVGVSGGPWYDGTNLTAGTPATPDT